MSDHGVPMGDAAEEFDWQGEVDLTSVSEGDLRESLQKLSEEEKRISYRRRVIQGRIDLIRAELVRRGGVTLSPEELTRVLMGDVPRDAPGGAPGGSPGGAQEPEGGP